MLFSYYFDVEKTHLLNCRFRVLQFVEQAAGVIDIMFSAEISEWQNGVQLKRETSVATFSFPPVPDGQERHDIDFTRVRVGSQKKWIFTVINNKNQSQKAEVGLISSSANKNPLGVDIHHDDSEFDAELKANNLSILEASYVPPVLTQTVVNTSFEQAGYPSGFTSLTGIHNGVLQNMTAKDFGQSFSEPIPASSSFKMTLDIAPKSVLPSVGNKIFSLKVGAIGEISMLTTALDFLIDGGSTSDIKRMFFDTPPVVTDFYEGTLKPRARITIEGDGAGALTVTYNGVTVHAIYDYTKEIAFLDFKGQSEEDTENDPNKWIEAIVDDITVTYRK